MMNSNLFDALKLDTCQEINAHPADECNQCFSIIWSSKCCFVHWISTSHVCLTAKQSNYPFNKSIFIYLYSVNNYFQNIYVGNNLFASIQGFSTVQFTLKSQQTFLYFGGHKFHTSSDGDSARIK